MELVIALIIAFAITLIIYYVGMRLSPKPPKTENKLMPYACGESFPPTRNPVRLLLMNFAALFMVFDVISLFLAFTIGIPPAYKLDVISLIILYTVVLAISIHMLGRRR
ncbi:MAG: NADH-quinone oxidoreductase subunit A [Thaumarchaeota archaeon]|nr:NADH-quinone oxidoreductase subunit A [Nitrososphaerota archaeon]